MRPSRLPPCVARRRCRSMLTSYSPELEQLRQLAVRRWCADDGAVALIDRPDLVDSATGHEEHDHDGALDHLYSAHVPADGPEAVLRRRDRVAELVARLGVRAVDGPGLRHDHLCVVPSLAELTAQTRGVSRAGYRSTPTTRASSSAASSTSTTRPATRRCSTSPQRSRSLASVITRFRRPASCARRARTIRRSAASRRAAVRTRSCSRASSSRPSPSASSTSIAR